MGAEVIRYAADLDVTVGYIPIGTRSSIAHMLGVPMSVGACDILSARLTEHIDLGRANGEYFFSSVDIPGGHVTIECDGNYRVTSEAEDSMVSVSNIANLFSKGGGGSIRSNPKDGRLEAIVRGKQRRRFSLPFQRSYDVESVFPVKRTKITAAGSAQAIADGKRVLQMPVTVEVVPKKLKIIVGKGRML